MVFMKEILEKVDFETKSADAKKLHEKLPREQRVKTELKLTMVNKQSVFEPLKFHSTSSHWRQVKVKLCSFFIH